MISFKKTLRILEEKGKLDRIRDLVSLHEIPGIIRKAEKALLFENTGTEYPVAANICTRDNFCTIFNMDWKKIQKKYKINPEDCLAIWNKWLQAAPKPPLEPPIPQPAPAPVTPAPALTPAPAQTTTESGKTCSYCGLENKTNAKFCQKCGIAF